MIDRAEDGETEPFYQALRASLARRPAPNELIRLFIRRHMESARGSEVAGGRKELKELVRETAQRFVGSADRAPDPNHPVGSVAARIRRALPDSQDWTLDVGEAAVNLLTFTGEHSGRLRAVLPPGFAEGRPGAFLRATRALLLPSENGPVRTTDQLLEDSADQQTFRAGMTGARSSDVLDLTWMVAGLLELRSVQERLERLTAAVLPGAPIRCAHYDEPRYRSALRLQLGDVSAPAANGGVLAEWPGRP